MTDDRDTTATLTPTQALVAATTAADDGEPVPRPSGALPARYVLGARLGIGGMGEVLLARDGQIGRDVAIKRMRDEASVDAKARFLREARIQGRLDHPAIVPVHELATDSAGQPFFVMKRLAGTTLADLLAAPTPPPREKLLRALADVCLAIEFAHSRGVIHRDLKPANIMLGEYGEVYVLDWGIARVDGEDDVPVADTTGEPASSSIATAPGSILDTPGYIAPELLRGERQDGRADVYALGAILFEILAGEPLLPRGHAALVAALARVDARPSCRSPGRDIPPELDAACVDATADAPAARPSARTLAERIEHYLDGDRDLALRRTLAAVHLATARAALARSDGDDDRSVAMREAGQAMALDPRNTDAAALIGRLVLEPPRAIPREVDARVGSLEEATARAKIKVLSLGMFCTLAFVPLMVWLGVRDPAAIALFAIAAVVNGAITFAIGRRAQPITAREIHIAALVHCCMVGLIARLFSPILIAPGIAAVSMMILVLDPRPNLRLMIALMTGAVFAPWGLELLGVWSGTLSVASADLVIHSIAVTAVAPQIHAVLAMFVIVLIGIAAWTGRSIGLAQREAMRKVELQAWHLRQVVGG